MVEKVRVGGGVTRGREEEEKRKMKEEVRSALLLLVVDQPRCQLDFRLQEEREKVEKSALESRKPLEAKVNALQAMVRRRF